MIFIYCTKIIVLSLLVAPFSCDAQQMAMKKKQTLVLPIMLPLGGTVNPMFSFATESAQLALDTINNQNVVLPNYNLVLNVADDTCTDSKAVQVTMKLFLNYKPNRYLGENSSSTEFGTFQPANFTFAYESAKIGHVVPLFLGGICSPACTATARFPQHFNFIDVVHACNDPLLSDRTKFPNFYRFLPSLIRVSGIRVQFLEYMNWRKVAIISDALPVSYADVFNLMKELQKRNVEIVSQEFFNDDPTEAISLVKASGSRIIFATCYVNVCPMLACSAYQQGLSGPKYIWIFRTTIDLLSPVLNRPKGCDKSMTDAFAERSLYIGADHEGNSLYPELAMTQTAVTLKQFNEYLASKTQNVSRTGGYGWRLIPFEMVHTAAHVLHNLEVELNHKNQTLLEVIDDSSRSVELTEMLRNKTLTVDIKGLYGRTAFLPNTTDPYTPNIIIDQVQNGVRKTVWLYDNPGAANLSDRFKLRLAPKWATVNKLPPKSHATEIKTVQKIPRSLIISNWIFGGLMILSLLGVDLFRRKKRSLMLVHLNYSLKSAVSSDLTSLTVVGSMVVQATVYTYPLEPNPEKMDIFCKSSAFITLVGAMTMTLALAVKQGIAKRRDFVQPDTTMGHGPRRFGVTFTFLRRLKELRFKFIPILAIHVILIIFWFTISDPPSSTVMLYKTEDEVLDIVWQDEWISCTLSDGSFNWLGAILALQCLIFLSGIVSAFKNRNEKFATASGVKESGIALNVLLTICVVSIIALGVLQRGGTVYGTMTAFSYTSSLTTIFVASRYAVIQFLHDLKRKGTAMVSTSILSLDYINTAGTSSSR